MLEELAKSLRHESVMHQPGVEERVEKAIEHPQLSEVGQPEALLF